MNNEPYGDASYSDKEGSDSGEKKSAKSRSKDARSGAQRYISNACKNCRALHRRCNGQPNCSNCKKRGIICEYGEPTKRGPKSRKGHADGDENYRDQNSKRSGKHKRGVTSSVQHGGAVPLYTSKNPFAESKQDVHGGAELSIIEQFSSEADARPVAVSNNEHGTFNAPFSSSAHDMMDKQLLEAAWSDLLQTWGTPVPSIALNLPHPLAYATAALHMMTHNVQLASSTLHLLSAGEHLSQQLPYYQPELLAAHAYRGVLIAFGLLTQNQRVQANQTMAATQQLINYLTSAQHGYNLDATTLLALAQFFSALYYINGGQSEVAARFAVAAFSTCQSYQDSRTRIPVSVWQRIYALRAALEDTDQQAWEGYSQLIIKDKTDPGRARPYDLLAHIVLVFLMTSNLFKNGVGFNLPSDVTVLHARMAELRELEVYLNKLVQSSTYAKQVSLGHFFLQSTLALLYLQYAKLHEMSLDDGLRQVHDCLSEARAHLTRVAGIKCCPALSLAIWLDTQLVRKLLELGKEVPNTVEAWSLLQSFNAPVVEERDKYPDNYCMPLNKLFATLISGTNREQHNSAKNSTAYQSQNYYNNNSNTFYHSPSSSSSTTPSNVTNNFQAPPRSIAGYTADQSYRSAPFAFNEQYSKSVMSQYQQYARPNYPTTSPNHSPNTPRQQQQYASNQYAAPTTTLNSNSASSFTSDPRSHSH